MSTYDAYIFKAKYIRPQYLENSRARWERIEKAKRVAHLKDSMTLLGKVLEEYPVS